MRSVRCYLYTLRHGHNICNHFGSSQVVACPPVVNGVEVVSSRFCFDGVELVLSQFLVFRWLESRWRGRHDDLVGWRCARLAERSARIEGASGGLESWQEPGGFGRSSTSQESRVHSGADGRYAWSAHRGALRCVRGRRGVHEASIGPVQRCTFAGHAVHCPDPGVSYTTPTPVVEDIAPAPVASYATPAPVVEYIAPAASYASPAPVDEHSSPVSAVNATPAPVVEYVPPAAGWDATPAPTVEYITPAPVGFTAPEPVDEHVVPEPAVDASRTPVVEYMASAPVVDAVPTPVVEYIAQTPTVCAAPAPVIGVHSSSSRSVLRYSSADRGGARSTVS